MEILEGFPKIPWFPNVSSMNNKLVIRRFDMDTRDTLDIIVNGSTNLAKRVINPNICNVGRNSVPVFNVVFVCTRVLCTFSHTFVSQIWIVLLI